MSNELENHEDLKSLLDEEYSLSIIDAYLVVNDVYYLNENGKLCNGKLAAPLNLNTPEELGPPKNHQMLWSGSPPFYADGTMIPNLGKARVDLKIGKTEFSRNLSNKPLEGFRGFQSYYSLVEHYVALISAPAQQKFNVTARTGAIYDVSETTSPFQIQDTFSARAEITDLNHRLSEDHIAIVGLGGTGSFILDFIAKTPVYSIDAFDFDNFAVHNAFRSPGKIPFDYFGRPKVDLFSHNYDSFRHRIKFYNHRVQKSDEELFSDTTFAFVCIDDGRSRSEICEMLNHLGIDFIDVGMGVEKEFDGLDGLIRTTFFSSNTFSTAIDEVPIGRDDPENFYRTLVQVAELNALNAAIAVLRYKQLRGFYNDEKRNYQSIISIGSSAWIGESMKYQVKEVATIPDELDNWTLYYSKEFEMSAHLCACGCGDIIYLPIGPVDYSITIGEYGPTLRPSIGNWNVCDAHYFITNGEVQWARKWTREEIEASRATEDLRREQFYSWDDKSILWKWFYWVKRFLGMQR